jgi:hypothetical protein
MSAQIETITATDRIAIGLSSSVPLRDRLSFTIEEAAAVSGLSRRALQGAIVRGELKGKVIGRRMIIARSNLLKLIGGDES